MFNLNPNQRTIKNISIEDKTKSEPYGIILRKAERIAARVLDNGTAAYMLYIHIALNSDKYNFAFSPAALEHSLGISKDRSRKAFKKLVDTGFLVQSKANKNHYIFNQLPEIYENMTFDTDEHTDTPSPVDGDAYTNRVEGCTRGAEGWGIPDDGDRNNTANTNNNTVNNIANNTRAEANNITVFSLDNSKAMYSRIKYRNKYWDCFRDIATEITKAILNAYLSKHTETRLQRKWGERYGRIIDGWNNELQRPNIKYSFGYFNKQSIKHNIQDIPLSYYECFLPEDVKKMMWVSDEEYEALERMGVGEYENINEDNIPNDELPF